MRKAIAYIALLILTLVYLLATIPHATRLLYNLEIITDIRHYGDLYALSYLPGYKQFHEPCTYRAPLVERKRKIRLVVIGDSYAEKLKPYDFSADEFEFVHWYNKLHVTIDPDYYNVLIIETTERATSRLAQPNSNLIIGNKNAVADKENINLIESIRRALGNTNVEWNIESMLFNNDVFKHLKELKAQLNHVVFSRIAPDVIISKNQNRLYYRPTIDTVENPNSSFSILTDSVINARVKGMYATSAQYKNAGFNRVIFSIIPNPVSVIEPEMGNYNHQIERIQNNGRLLHIEYIDAYHLLNTMGEKAFYLSDTHWNCEGISGWLDEINWRVLVVDSVDARLIRLPAFKFYN